ncbi:hypothetical protein CKO28_00550 [Rhodovibrio sodomensis]|uniref:Uncharacterized protein n=1 Tax=Rhodovibrio sodomensis TaxID=1088 RepID=A0ABS1DAS5_9PROT|nr:hypothetical protein [Rhodovibrio sodomensis]MBK1666530.1 hypothetical protein [Rhodovibrio sodomensis]
MTWWCTSVVGGKSALRVLAELEDLLEVPRASLYPFTKIDPAVRTRAAANFVDRLDEIERLIKAHSTREGGETIPIQVVAAAAMAVGARMPHFFRLRAMAAANNDDWARRNQERRRDMDALAQLIGRFDGRHRMPLEEDPLLAAMLSARLKKLPEPSISATE